jgi:two-component system response regulator FixJ
LSSSPVVHVVDDDAAVRKSLAFLLSTAGMAVRVHESAIAFLQVLSEVKDGCVVTDIRMPVMDGLQLQRELIKRQSSLPVIVITGHGDVPLAVEALKAGASDFIEKPFDDEIIIVAIRSALARHANEAQNDARNAQVKTRLTSLSEREQEVLNGLIVGKPNKIIAYDLSLSARTVEIYRANVMTKMEAKSLSELVRMVLVANGTL